MKIKNLFFILTYFLAVILSVSGCATIPTREALPTYNINGATYLSLVSLCEARGINWEYDTLTRTVVLKKDTHKINLMVGDSLALVDGESRYLNDPVDIYQGMLVVPYKFKERIIDVLFKEYYPGRRAGPLLSRIKKIVIDAGHGGMDPGAIGRTGLREKAVTLDIAKRLANLLRQEGVSVIMTRSADTTVSLTRRVDIANNAEADLFLSIHANANRVRSLKGFEIYYLSPRADDSRRALSAAQNVALDLEGASFAGKSLSLKAILWDMIYTYNRAESVELARTVCRNIDRNLDTRILGIKGANFYVLKGVRVPAVLIETGFLSNYDEERLLRNGYHRQQIAGAIKDAISDYAQDLAMAEVNR
jgi:N-acetylmuramoyl-L-alanine amidase